jgi:hypothetical protein
LNEFDDEVRKNGIVADSVTGQGDSRTIPSSMSDEWSFPQAKDLKFPSDELNAAKEEISKDPEGAIRKFKSGAVREALGDKGRMDLLPPRALIELSKHFQQGARKYEERNWEKGMPLSQFIDSGMRHLAKLMMGRHDERHDRAAAWNIMCFLETVERIKEGILPRELDDIGWLE